MATPASQSRRKRSGDATERHVAALNAACKLAGIASLTKQHTEVRILGRALGRVSGVLVGKATCDYAGVMLDGTGRAVAVEVKSHKSRAAFPLSEIQPHQRDALDEVDRAGGVAVVLVVGVTEVYALPWHRVAQRIREGRVSVPMELLKMHVVARVPYLAAWRKEGTKGDRP